MLKKKLSEYTEDEFHNLLNKLFNGECTTENEYDELVDHIITLAEHPKGSDILFYPAPGIEDSPEGVLQVIKEWRAQQGLPGFNKID